MTYRVDQALKTSNEHGHRTSNFAKRHQKRISPQNTIQTLIKKKRRQRLFAYARVLIAFKTRKKQQLKMEIIIKCT